MVRSMSAEPPDYGGMTVNERLFVAGLVEQFDAAIKSRDRRRAVDLLRQVAMSESEAGATTDTVLAKPTEYGFPRES